MAVASRFVEWFWLRGAERSARAETGKPSERALELIARAALATEVAVRTERPPEPFAHGSGEVIAAELYREAAHWALLAHAELKASRTGESDEAAPKAAEPLDVSFERVDRALLVRAAGGEAELERLRADLAGSYREFAELEPSAQRQLVERLERSAQTLLEPLGSMQRQLERIWVRRVLHVLGVLLCVGVAVLGTRQLARIQQRQHDYAVKAPWTVSSRYPQGGCESPRQDCSGGENYFFHTIMEQDPWIIFDLGRERRISTVEVDNRLDCCTTRANLLAIDVSTDKKKWREVARHTGDFTTMRESFEPVRARYVKIHVPAPDSILHLSHVRIFP